MKLLKFWYVRIAPIAAGVVFALEVRAEPWVTVLDAAESPGCSPVDIALRLEEDSLLEVRVESTIVSAQTDTAVLAAKSTETGIVSSVPVSVGLDDAQVNLIVADKGDVLQLQWPHQVCLNTGLYAEAFDISVVTPEGLVQQSGSRYFEISDKGVRPISGEAYEKVALKFIRGPRGTMDIVGSGVEFGTVPENYMDAKRVPSTFKPFQGPAAGQQ